MKLEEIRPCSRFWVYNRYLHYCLYGGIYKYKYPQTQQVYIVILGGVK